MLLGFVVKTLLFAGTDDGVFFLNGAKIGSYMIVLKTMWNRLLMMLYSCS